MPVDAELLGQRAAVGPVAEHHGRLGPHLAVANRPQQAPAPARADTWCKCASRGRSLRSSGDQTRMDRPFKPADLGHLRLERRPGLGWQFDPQQHGEQAELVMVVHLDFGDVGAQARDVVNDRIGQPTVVGADGGDDDLHGGQCAGTILGHGPGWSRFSIIGCPAAGASSVGGLRLSCRQRETGQNLSIVRRKFAQNWGIHPRKVCPALGRWVG